jgi:excisionase family DNA binding protein
MTTSEAAAALACSTSTVQRRIRAGSLAHLVHNGHYFVRRDEVTASAARPDDEGSGERWVEHRFALASELVRRRLDLDDEEEIPPMLRQTEVARVLGVDVRQVRTATDNGLIPSLQLEKRSLVSSLVVIEILSGGAVAA